METRVISNPAYQIPKINMSNFIEVAPKGFPRGTWLLWKTSVDFKIDILKTQNRFIHRLIRDNKKDSQLLATFVYGYPLQLTKETMEWKTTFESIFSRALMILGI